MPSFQDRQKLNELADNFVAGDGKLEERLVCGNEHVVEAAEDEEGSCKAVRSRGNKSPKACEKARASPCFEKTKEGKVVAETGGVRKIVPVPEEEGAEEDGWLDPTWWIRCC